MKELVVPQPSGQITYMIGDESWLEPCKRSPRRLFSERWGNLGPLELDKDIVQNKVGLRVKTQEILAPDWATNYVVFCGVYYWTDGEGLQK